jgi:glycosyltransferase involved in cell wall biosynthesis
MANDIAREIHLSAQKVIVLPNPIEVAKLRDAISESSERGTGPGPHLLAIGRLSQEKGFDLLLRW